MILLVQKATSEDPKRQAEYDFVLRRNQTPGLFSEVVVLEGRPTFREMFALASERFKGQVVVIANSDILFNATIALANTHLGKNEVWALTRWEAGASGPRTRKWNTQDVWVFKAPLPDIEKANFTLGYLACDCCVARLLLDAGLKVTNPSISVKTVHWHKSKVRTSGTDLEATIQLPRACILPTELPPRK